MAVEGRLIPVKWTEQEAHYFQQEAKPIHQPYRKAHSGIKAEAPFFAQIVIEVIVALVRCVICDVVELSLNVWGFLRVLQGPQSQNVGPGHVANIDGVDNGELAVV